MDQKERMLMEKVAKLYYLEGWTQNQICKKVGLSRPIISKLLKQAREKNIVEIYIKDRLVHTVDLERMLETKYDLKEAIVVSAPDKSSETIRRHMGQAATAYLTKQLNDTKKIGISWGKSLYSFVEEFQSKEYSHIHLVPLIGGLGQNHLEYHSNQLSFSMAQQLDARASYLYAPAIADSAELRHSLMNSKDVAAVLEDGRTVDIAIVGVGSVTNETTAVDMGYLKEEEIASLKADGAAGDLNSSFFDGMGRLVDSPINDRIIGIGLEDIRAIPEVIAIAEGEYKTDSLHIALKAGFINVLVTDDKTAERLIEKHG